MGVCPSVFVGPLGLGRVLGPLLIDWLGNRGALAVTGAALRILAVVAWPRLRALDERVAGAPAHVDLLREIPIFRPLPAATVEQLARKLRPVHSAAGEEIVRQGEHGDRFYVVKKGEVAVRVDDGPPHQLGSGAFFGEIALLRDMPRTATVTARTDVDLLTLERDEFIA